MNVSEALKAALVDVGVPVTKCMAVAGYNEAREYSFLRFEYATGGAPFHDVVMLDRDHFDDLSDAASLLVSRAVAAAINRRAA